MTLIYIIFFVFVLLLLLPAIIFSIITQLLSLFGFKKRERKYYENVKDNTVNVEGTVKRKGKKKRIFDKDEGEYVDFEEMK